MLKYLFVGLVVAFIYRFWNSKPKIDRTGNEPEESDDYIEFEEID